MTETRDFDRLRVAVVDDHPAMREGTAALLGQEADIEVVATGATAADARRILASSQPPDVLLLDIRLGDEGGLDVLRSDGPEARTAIVLVTAYDQPQYEEAGLRLGAAGFVLKSAPVAELKDAVRRAAAGQLVFRRHSGHAAAADLSARERTIVVLVAEGRSNDEIAARLGLSAKTIEVALSALYRRFAVVSRTELVARALREGWLDVPA